MYYILENVLFFKDQSNHTSTSLDLVNSRKWKRHQSVDVTSYPHCLCNVGNQLYQCLDGGIAVYDNNLNQVKNITSGNMGIMWDVCNMPNGDLVVAAYNGLYHTKTNGEYQSHDSSAFPLHLHSIVFALASSSICISLYISNCINL